MDETLWDEASVAQAHAASWFLSSAYGVRYNPYRPVFEHAPMEVGPIVSRPSTRMTEVFPSSPVFPGGSFSETATVPGTTHSPCRAFPFIALNEP